MNSEHLIQEPGVSRRTIPIYHGGLMRCCLETLRQYEASPEYQEQEGQELQCRWGRTTMVVRDGGWRWDSKWEVEPR